MIFIFLKSMWTRQILDLTLVQISQNDNAVINLFLTVPKFLPQLTADWFQPSASSPSQP